MKRYIIPILITVILASCGVAKALPTSTPSPTPSPTPIPLSDIDLEASLILPGDLPPGYSSSQILDTPNLLQGEEISLEYENSIHQLFEKKGEETGHVTVLLYKSFEKRDATYNLAVDGFGESEIIIEDDYEITHTVDVLPDIGEKSIFSEIDFPVETEFENLSVYTVSIAFVRCHAFVYINMTELFEIDLEFANVSAYAKRLDSRLSDLVCK